MTTANPILKTSPPSLGLGAQMVFNLAKQAAAYQLAQLERDCDVALTTSRQDAFVAGFFNKSQEYFANGILTTVALENL